MNLRNLPVLFILLGILFLNNSCGEKATDKASVPDAQAKEEVNTKIVSKVPVEAIIIKTKIVEQNIPLTGVLKPIHSVDIMAEVTGEIKKIYKKLGDSVTPRDTLAIIDDKIPLSQYRQARSQVLSAKNNLKIAELNLRSDKELYDNGDISNLEYENSQLNVKSAEANHLSALANLSLMEENYRDTRITSPIKGLISRKFIELGTMVNPNTPVYRIVDLSKLKLEVGVPQDIISKLKVGDIAKVKISALNSKMFEGQVQFISPQADENTGAFTAEIHVVNNREMEILAGMTAKIELTISNLGKQLVVPDYAFVTRNGSNYLYKIQDDLAMLTRVVTGGTFGSQVIIKEGLAEGDTVVVVGMKNLGTESKVFIETIQ